MKLTMSRKVDMGNEPVGRLLATLAIPAITSQVVNALYNMVDRIYIGHIPEVGAAALTGVGVCFPILMLITAFANLIGMGGAPRAGIFMGRGDYRTAEKILGNSFASLALIAVALTIPVLLFHEQILYLFGASGNTVVYGSQYITIYALGTIFVQLTLGMNAFISAQGFSKISMLTVIIGAVINIILDPILIFGLHMGVRGAAVATVISQCVSTVWAVSFLRGKNTRLRLKRKNMRIEKSVLMPCIALGIAPFVMTSTESLLMICFNSSLLNYGGDLAVGAMTILSSIRQFTLLPLNGITQGGQPIISFNYGAKDMSRVRRAFKLQTTACFTYGFIVWTLVELFPSAFIMLFTSDPALLEISRWSLRVYMAGVVLTSLQLTCQQTIIALGNAKTSVFLAVLRKLILLIPLIYILPMFMTNDVFAVFLAEPVADVIAVSTTLVVFVRFFRKLNKTMN